MKSQFEEKKQIRHNEVTMRIESEKLFSDSMRTLLVSIYQGDSFYGDCSTNELFIT